MKPGARREDRAGNSARAYDQWAGGREMAGPSTEFMRGLERDDESWSPMTSWRPTGRTCARSLWKHAGSGYRSCYPARPRGCETTSN